MKRVQNDDSFLQIPNLSENECSRVRNDALDNCRHAEFERFRCRARFISAAAFFIDSETSSE